MFWGIKDLHSHLHFRAEYKDVAEMEGCGYMKSQTGCLKITEIFPSRFWRSKFKMCWQSLGPSETHRKILACLFQLLAWHPWLTAPVLGWHPVILWCQPCMCLNSPVVIRTPVILDQDAPWWPHFIIFKVLEKYFLFIWLYWICVGLPLWLRW